LYAGTNKKFEQKALNLMINCVEEIKSGEFSSELFKNIIKKNINQLKSTEDEIMGVLTNYYNRKLFGTDEIEKRIKIIKQIKKEDIIKFSKKVLIDTSYILTEEDK
jgi:predicted Zn-dependent peptidase